MKRIALVVGHSATAPGAVNYLGVSEFEFHKPIATNVAIGLEAVYQCQPKVFLRTKSISNLGAEVRKFDPHYSLELHFNAAEYPVTGAQTEILCLPNKLGTDAAQKLAAAFEKVYGLGLRRSKGAKILQPESRGWTNLFSTGKMDALLIEPVFANFETTPARVFFKDAPKYTQFLIDYIARELKLPNRQMNLGVKEKMPAVEDFKTDLIAAIDRLTAALEAYRNS